jgi:hypothetical protein
MKIVCCFALQAEAKPWIETVNARLYYQQKHLRYYSGRQVDILVSGMGSLAMATAIGWLNAFLPDEKCVWNIGCAASLNKPRSSWHRVAKLTGEWSGMNLYPEILSAGRLPLVTLHTVNRVANTTFLNSIPNCLVDMEGYAFATAARQFLPVTQIQLLKWVSDVGEEKFYLNEQWQQHYSEETENLLQYIQYETEIVNKHSATYYPEWNAYVEKVNEKLSLTFSQKVQLKNALSFAMQYQSVEYIEQLIQTISLQVEHKAKRNTTLVNLMEQLYAI